MNKKEKIAYAMLDLRTKKSKSSAGNLNYIFIGMHVKLN